MVGIVGILLLGSLAWSAVGALFAALSSVTTPMSAPRPTPGGAAALVGTPTPIVAHATPTPLMALLATPVIVLATPESSIQPTSTSAPPSAATPEASGRAPWVLLPQPAPSSRVAPGPITIEARGRGESPITTLKLELDGAALSTSFEQRSESTWRAAATVQVNAGKHTVRATVIDDKHRTGGFRWTFDAGP
ncbi:MAG: hypothetical protein NVSMB2_18600 [Chloroflexota bacterium]